MPPKVTDTRSPAEPLHAVEEETAAAARKVVASYAENFFDGVTLMCMLGVEPAGLSYKKVYAEYADTIAPKKTTKRSKKTTKKATKKAMKKATAKKTTKKATKATKKTTKKTTKKA